jgi:hypothetical protein
MSIKVYWACIEDGWMAAEEPESVIKRLKSWYNPKDISNRNGIIECPSVRGSLKNLYALKSIYDYDFTIQDGTIIAPKMGQEFFDSHVEIRSIEHKLFSFYHKFIFFTEDPSLEVTFYEHPFFENNEVSKNCMPVQGKFDIGKWFRNIEFPFFLRPESNTFSIRPGDAYCYIRFNTDSHIDFLAY